MVISLILVSINSAFKPWAKETICSSHKQAQPYDVTRKYAMHSSKAVTQAVLYQPIEKEVQYLLTGAFLPLPTWTYK